MPRELLAIAQRVWQVGNARQGHRHESSSIGLAVVRQAREWVTVSQHRMALTGKEEGRSLSGQLAAVVLAVLVGSALVLTGLTARWVVGHPERIRAGLAWVAERPAVVWVRSRYPRQWRVFGCPFGAGGGPRVGV